MCCLQEISCRLQVQAVRTSTITKLFRDLLTSGGRDGQPLAVATMTNLHAMLRKAFREPWCAPSFRRRSSSAS